MMTSGVDRTDRLSVVVVTFNSVNEVGDALRALAAQLREGDELVVVDNASQDGTPEAVAEAAPEAVLVRNSWNAGFAAAANDGAARARGDLLLFLNQDAVPQPGFAEAIRAPLADGRGWSAWMGLVTAGNGRVVNTSGGVVHFTGIAWAGEAGTAVDRVAQAPHEVAFASGACLAVPHDVWRRAGGFPESFFMYCEDVDLSLRLRLAGETVGVEPGARVDHDYSFDKGPRKWRLLERNRFATLVRTYPSALLLAVAPALIATELALWAVAVTGGWGSQKLLATGDSLKSLPRLLRERREIQSTRAVGAADFAASLTPELSSPFLGRVGEARVVRLALRAYWRAVLLLLRSS